MISQNIWEEYIQLLQQKVNKNNIQAKQEMKQVNTDK